MLLEQTVIIRAFLLRNKKTLFLFEAFGMSSKEKRRVLFCLIQGFIWFSVITGYLLAALIGFTYINSALREYGKFYISSLHHNVLTEAIIVGIVLIGLFIFVEYIKNEPVISGLSGKAPGRQKRYRFKKLNISVAIIQTACIIFTMASFNFMNTFSGEDGVMDYDLCSKRATVCYPLREYSVALYGDDRFSFEALDAFAEYEDNISLSAEAETNQSTILLESDNTDSYFSRYCVYDGDMLRPKDGEEALWKQVSDEAEQYRPVPAGDDEISDPVPKDNTEKSCVLLLPDYNEVSSNPSVKEKEMIRLGGIWGDEKNVEFCSENFRIEAIRSCDGEESSAIQIIMSEEVAKNSKTVVGYDSIRVVVNKDTPVSIQKDIEQKVIHLMASVQGGLLDSSGQRNSRDELMRNYTVFMSNTILFFCIIVICIYIILSISIDREKYGYEYGVLRSFGMSYTTLQKKIFFQYGNGIIVACIFNIFLGKHAFTNGLLTWRQIIISIGITAGVTFLCGIWEFYRRKRHSQKNILRQTLERV